jgi:hypothetical protein
MNTGNKFNTRLSVLLGIVFVATISRIMILPKLGYFSNFSPIDSIALFSGCYFSKRWQSVAITILSVLIGDMALSLIMGGVWTLFYPGFYWQYASYILMVLMGSMVSRKMNAVSLLGACVASSLLFFTITNFGTWLSWSLYPKTLSGLSACYVAAIPFLKNTVISDILYSGIFFGVFELAQKKYSSLRLA